MNDSVSAFPNERSSHFLKSRGFSAAPPADAAREARSEMMPTTSFSGRRHRLACTGYPTHEPRMCAGE